MWAAAERGLYEHCEALHRGNLPPTERGSVAVESQVSSSLGCSLAEADYTRVKARGDVTLQLLAPAEC